MGTHYQTTAQSGSGETLNLGAPYYGGPQVQFISILRTPPPPPKEKAVKKKKKLPFFLFYLNPPLPVPLPVPSPPPPPQKKKNKKIKKMAVLCTPPKEKKERIISSWGEGEGGKAQEVASKKNAENKEEKKIGLSFFSQHFIKRGGKVGGGLEEEVADPGYHGQGTYSNSTIPPKMCFWLELLAWGRDRGGGVRFFSSYFSSWGGEGGRGRVGTRNK